MRNIKNYDEFVSEGLLSAIKNKWKLTSVNAFVMEEATKLVEKNPNKYKNGVDVMNALKNEIRKTYEQNIKGEDAIEFDQWWKEYAPNLANLIVVGQ